MSDPLASVSTLRTPQGEQADPRQEKNSAGGYTFVPDELAQLRRFLTLGSTGGTYYVGQRELTKANAQLVLELARTRTAEVVAEVLAISAAGRAPKQNPALFALAAAAKLGDADGRKAALAAVPLVARTGTQLFLFAGYLQQFGGWGRGTRRAIGSWYVDPSRDVENVAYQALKYRQREGWTHADLLRLSHPKTIEPARRELFNWIHGREAELTGLPLLVAFERIQAASSVSEVADLVTLNRGISWEMIPDRFQNEPAVWESLLSNGLPQTALLRQLPRLTRLGLLGPFSDWTGRVAAQLSDPERLKKGRIHPVNVLVAQRTYASGQGVRGVSTWSPSQPIVDALDAAFYTSFGAVEPTGKRLMLALDVSGSMVQSVSGLPLTCREASAALALVTAATESQYELVGFTSAGSASVYSRPALTRLAISPRQRLDDVVRAVSDLSFGGTDCSLPMRHALAKGLEIDAFVVFTDNETWHGEIHPYQALREYRQRTGIDARLIVVAMTATGRTIADPHDAGMLDVSGFDSAVPALISNFARGL
ncbi:TROVE domain-containing protein [Streptomyces sp. SID13031]|uniref:TROVE domain-containing protein n=1 Tax=Streptomyces sp. SID13031 TaxID=2706046 RepID=UPI0013C6004E|nr:TROVE domain-containing protein [Streptomyces sp. SID13031]NEA33495.1 TROVE domain-containing protein [Streptomyces sp. SID13031]